MSISLTGPVLLSVEDGIARLTLNRPEQANSFDLPTAEAFAAAVERMAADDDVRVVLLTGNGARFCAGGDVASFAAAPDRSGYIRELAEVLDGAMQRLTALPLPVVAGVQGAAAGAGLSVMLGADVIVAEPSTKFVTAYAGIGLTPDIGLSWLLPRAIGQVRALDLLLTGRVLDAAEAQQWGLITEVVAADTTAADRAHAIARRMADTVPGALGQARRLVRSGWDSTREAVGIDESDTIAARVRTDEASVLIERFVAGR